MAIKEYCLEMRGMPRSALEDYFLKIGGKQIEQGLYLGPSWEVHLSEEKTCTIGSLSILATLVTFRLDEEDWPEIVKAFRFNFLSAGG